MKVVGHHETKKIMGNKPKIKATSSIGGLEQLSEGTCTAVRVQRMMEEVLDSEAVYLEFSKDFELDARRKEFMRQKVVVVSPKKCSPDMRSCRR